MNSARQYIRKERREEKKTSKCYDVDGCEREKRTRRDFFLSRSGVLILPKVRTASLSCMYAHFFLFFVKIAIFETPSERET